jgi:uncharacterized membrane protein
MSDQMYLLILRFFHIGFGIFWAGSVIYFAVFMIPAVKASGPEGAKFMQQLGKTGYSVAVMISAIITIVAGFLLIRKLSGGFQPEWFSTKYGRILSIGGGMAFIAFIIGFIVNRPAAARINKISNTISKQGAPPSPEQIKELTSLRNKLFGGTKIIAALLAIAVIAMSIWRYA